jgi:hypothetical protein
MADHPDFAKRDLSSVRAGTRPEALPPQCRPAGPDLAPNLLGSRVNRHGRCSS